MNKKKIIILFSLFVMIFLLLICKNINKNVYVENNDKNIINDKALSIFLETEKGSGIYKQSETSKWPGSGYAFNAELSQCKNGSQIIWDEETNSVSVKLNKTDKCQIYFDIESADLVLRVENNVSTYGKIGNINCGNSSATYNQQYNRIEISSMNTRYESCLLNYSVSTSKVNLASYIIGLSGTTQGTGQVINEKGYRYEGKDPNNYVWFNNELWRIVGAFDSATHGISGTNLVKIIRANPIGSLTYSKNNTNNWSTASLNLLLNDSYYNAEDGTTSGYCYSYMTTATSNCNYTHNGIQAKYRNMIKKVTWHLGSNSSNAVTSDTMYTNERSTSVYSSNPSSVTAYVGLIYPSDYGYSVLASSCARTTNLSAYGQASCGGQSWLFGVGYQWTITPFVGNGKSSYRIRSDGIATGNADGGSNIGYGVRPVVYLDSSVLKLSGDGSQKSPYIIGM